MIPPHDPRPAPRDELRADADAEVREDAFELFMAEAARMRLTERAGDARVALRSGAVLTGELSAPGADAVGRHLHLVDSAGRSVLVSVDAVTAIIGASAALREESTGHLARSLASRLRECWAAGSRLRVLLCDGRWIEGGIVLVASDHLELIVGGDRWVVPFAASEAWDLGYAA